MTSLQCVSLRHCVSWPATCLQRYQCRWARVHDVRFLATHQGGERITDRYRHKLEQKAKEQGLENISELKEAYKERIKDLRKRTIAPGAARPPPLEPAQFDQSVSSASQWKPQEPTSPASNLQSVPKTPTVKTLSSFLDVSKTLELPPREIESLWRLRHANSPQSICAAIPTSTFAEISATARKHPQFILPGLPRSKPDAETDPSSPAPEGAPIHFMQWSFTGPDTITVLFTHLAEYKLRGEYAQPHTTVTHHLELSAPKGLVLCQGSVMEGRGVSVEEAKWLVMCMQKFYNTSAVEDGGQQQPREPTGVGEELRRRRRKLVEQFTKGDADFKVENLLEEAERMG